MKYAYLLALCALTGCNPAPPDLAKMAERGRVRHELFVECMNLLPAGPQATKYNDWDEVVDACSSNAFYKANGLVP
jgi:hypothetical protein